MSSMKNEMNSEYKNPNPEQYALGKLAEKTKWTRQEAIQIIVRYRLDKQMAVKILELLESSGYLRVSKRMVFINKEVF